MIKQKKNWQPHDGAKKGGRWEWVSWEIQNHFHLTLAPQSTTRAQSVHDVCESNSSFFNYRYLHELQFLTKTLFVFAHCNVQKENRRKKSRKLLSAKWSSLLLSGRKRAENQAGRDWDVLISKIFSKDIFLEMNVAMFVNRLTGLTGSRVPHVPICSTKNLPSRVRSRSKC